MIEMQAKSVHEAFLKATEVVASWSSPEDPTPYCWFRGVSDADHSLLPGAYWRSGYEEYEPLVSFCQEGGAYADVGQIHEWETYYLAQHHGIPTRLLDWTESFSAALFFALDGWTGSTRPCVWILKPAALNKYSIGWEGIIAPNNFPQQLDIWLPGEIKKKKYAIRQADEFTYDNRNPLAIYPRKMNRRIVAQQGAFTVHGQDKACLLTYIRRCVDKPESVLGRIVIDGADVEEATRHLEMLGVRRSSMYPDIDNYVRHLKGLYEW